jgi:double-stranded uracil-DNA glycosylase
MPECFPPVVGDAPKVLILGTMPGRVSLEKRQYYAHPQNQFWRLLGAALKTDLAALPYEKRLCAVTGRGVALWEVFAACEREGSLDSAIENPEPNPVPKLVRESGIKAVFCNGGTAWRAFQQHFADALPGGTEAFPLPSSSPAHAGRTFEEKLASWLEIARYV